MCGIAGTIGLALDQGAVGRTLALMANRGPDHAAHWAGNLSGQPLHLLHSRLSIIDLDPRSHQPFSKHSLVIVYNGEVFNYRELRQELEAAGHSFATDSDTEVILEAYMRWGADCVRHFNGMWAFALHDQRTGILLLSRDRLGEKPLYWMRSGGGLVFGSEVKFLAALSGNPPSANQDQVLRYLVHGYRALYKRPATWFNDVHELPAGTNMVLTSANPRKPAPYWTLSHAPVAMTADEAREETRLRLRRALELRLRADVPIAFCLSGGVDSTSLAGMAVREFGAKISTFSIIDRDERYDERQFIDTMIQSLQCEPVLVHTSTDGFFDRMEKLVGYHDAPVVTISYYVHSFLSEEISKRGYRIAISGTGADELFTGYYDHYLFWLAEQHERADFPTLVEDWRAGMGSHVRNPNLQDPRRFVRQPSDRGHILLNDDLFRSLLKDDFTERFSEVFYTGALLRNRMMNELLEETVPVMLKEDDLNSMLFSVENRSPFMDHELVEFAYTIPTEHLIRDGLTKWPLRAAMDGIVPDEVRLNRQKRGFNAAITSLVDLKDKATRDRLLSDGPIFDIIDRDRLASFIAGGVSTNSLSKFLFSFISAKLFLERQPGATP